MPGVEDAECKEFFYFFLEDQLDTSIDIEDAQRTPGRPPRVIIIIIIPN